MSQPILVFDSGIGGLSVLAEIKRLIPAADYLYLFDNARLPYGELAEQVLIDGCVALICQQVELSDAKLVVVACNTASTLVLPPLRQKLSIPVVGVVPAIKPAANISAHGRIGLLATPGTIKRTYTQQLIDQFAPDCHVSLYGSSELVMIAERKLAGHVIELEQLQQILAPIKADKLDTLVLGCTHFPLLKDEISQVLGDAVVLLDSGEAVARRVQSLLCEQKVGEGQAELIGIYTTEQISPGLYQGLMQQGFTKLASYHACSDLSESES
ncbi:glutamate racemase [Shewanella sp. NIFS-20-20]|uniref:glutamate racemase n=1 Tax=Shewanella sp. NIFS-20-20 TaxID=2853806 RepID=UPI001C46B390|nr:glutamate racemase [Shewanella sp. NIFS-20-20]MBV7316713.1 glutamate racemase [Shewanella sp. NIFS-20-20]